MKPSEFIRHFKTAAEYLAGMKDEINKLNVFPVPDGDTGTNMSLTIMSVCKELEALPPSAGYADIRKAVTHGSLMGARGNSGVITSQILRGFCEGLEGAESFDTAHLALALDKAVEVSYAAVRRPVEGTILTVVKDVATAAAHAETARMEISTTLRLLVDEAFASVRRTPDFLPVLKENNVVDAGGFGLALLMQGFVAALNDEAPVPMEVSVVGDSGSAEGESGSAAAEVEAASGRSIALVAIEQINDWEGSEYLYCTEFLLDSPDLDTAETLEFLATMGDCELLVGSHPSFKIHLHTDDPGQVLSYMTLRGQVMDVHIHNMRLQSIERNAVLAAENALAIGGSGAAGDAFDAGADGSQAGWPMETAPAPGAPAAPAADLLEDIIVLTDQSISRPRGYIAVASGFGMHRILESLGVDVIVNGGQTMNPSTAEIVKAIDAVNADEVVVFPNNKNIIMAAQAAADVSDKDVAVIPTRSVPESFSALFVANSDQSIEDEVEEMIDAIAAVRSAEITHAIKESTSEHGEAIAQGDVIGITEDAIHVVGTDIKAVALQLVAIIADDDCDTLTLLAGEQLDSEQLQSLVEAVEGTYPDLEVDARRGDQPLYPLIMAAE